MKDEALKLALEALEVLGWQPTEEAMDYRDNAISAIKEALAQPEQEPKCNPHPKAPHGFNRNASHANDRYTCECESWDAYEAGRLAGIAQEQAMYEVQRLGQEIQPEQEPVSFPRQSGDSTWTVDTAFIWRVKHTIDPDTPHDFTPSEEQIETVLLALEKIPSSLYTTPPQRKPLTDEQIKAIFDSNTKHEISDAFGFARAIEAAHGIKE